MWTIAARGATDRERKVRSVQISHTHFRVEFPRFLKPTHCGCAAAPHLAASGACQLGVRRPGAVWYNSSRRCAAGLRVKKPTTSRHPKRQTTSRTGGAATGRGVEYHTQYSVYRALLLLQDGLCIPDARATIGIEPRVPSSGAVTAWDTLVSGGAVLEELIEAKASPKHSDVVEWLDRVARGNQEHRDRTFQFVYGRETRLLLSLDRLIRIAAESGDDQQKFSRLIEIERKPEFEEALSRLGGEALGILRKMSVRLLPEEFLSEGVSFRSRALAGAGGTAITDHLYTKFSRAMSARASFDINDLLTEIRDLGLELQVPPDAGAMPEPAASAAFVLQYLHSPIAIPVLAVGLGATVDNLQSSLKSETFVIRGEVCEPTIFSRKVYHPQGRLLLASVLEALLGHIANHKTDRSGLEQIRNAMDLARECVEAKPGLVTRMYDVLDKPAKRLGDKRLVLKAAELCISAARRSNREQADVQLEAKALICGRSWVRQRTGELAEAGVAADESIRLGDSVNDDKNTAFCKKCIGRLKRMQAESAIDESIRKELLVESESLLREAIERFSALSGHGPTHPEVGDCHSLLGRTFLVGGQFENARAAIKRAYELISDTNSKDYLDLEILAGDLEAAHGRRDEAQGHYDTALAMQFGDNQEVSEIFARGYFQRGSNAVHKGDVRAAVDDLRRAGNIWKGLEEHELSARAEFRARQLEGTVPALLPREWQAESFAIRLMALDIHQERLAARGRSASARRDDPGVQYWRELLPHARTRCAIDHFRW